MNNLSDYFNSIENISHAFLIGNVIFDEIEKELTDIIKEKLIKIDNLNLRENPDIYFYDQYSSLVTKENVKNLLNNLSKTSQFNNVKIYIINGADKLSDTVNNSILKTLEEPKSNIYAFLITKNIDSVKETIKSRCQKIYLNSKDNNDIFDEEIERKTNNLIKAIESNKVKAIALNSLIYDEIKTRDEFQIILKCMLTKYNNSLKILINNTKNNEENNEIFENNDIISLSKKILIIDKFINLLDSYLNKNLSIDKFIIEMWRCN